MKKLLLTLFIFSVGILAYTQQDSTKLSEYVGKYPFPGGNILSYANILYSKGSLNYESNQSSGSLINKGVDTFLTDDKYSTVVFTRNEKKKIVGVVIDDVRGVHLEGKKEEAVNQNNAVNTY